MNARTPLLLAAAALVAAGISGCGSGGGSPIATVTVTTSAPASPTVSPTASISSSAPQLSPTTSAVTPSVTSTSAAQDLTLTPAVRQELVDAGATARHLSPSDFYLAHGTGYYAVDNQTDDYWAAGSLRPTPGAPIRAQVSSQDEGGYTVFEEVVGSDTWTATDVGAAEMGGTCQITPPADVAEAWGWAVGTCYPPRS